MARKQVTHYFDDLDNTPLTDEEVEVIRFGFNGTEYTIDLSQKNADRFRELMTPYVEVATRRVLPASNRRSSGAARNSRAREIRQWALDQGKEVARRGKIPADVIEAYNNAHR